MCLNLISSSFAIYSPQGYLYDKKAILEYILHQKTEIARKMKVSIALHPNNNSNDTSNDTFNTYPSQFGSRIFQMWLC